MVDCYTPLSLSLSSIRHNLILTGTFNINTYLFADNVERIRQNFDERVNNKLVQQINYELQASYLYQAYVSIGTDLLLI